MKSPRVAPDEGAADVSRGAKISPLHSLDPTELGNYQVKGRLGEGGMGTVYLAEDAEGRQVALKVIRADLAAEPDFRRRFRSEVNRAKQVPPFCTAEVLDADPDHEHPYLVVEFVDGPSLADVVNEQGPLTPANLHGLAIGMATALVAIHGAGVIHRDLKPRNVLLPPGSPKVIDFGIARAMDSTSNVTKTHEMLGTVAYMPPERLDTAAKMATTSKADIFAWGVVVMFAGTGRTPFQDASMPLTAMRILTEEPDLEGLSPELKKVVAAALAKKPADRPTARKLLDMLLDGSGEATDELPPPEVLAAVEAPSAAEVPEPAVEPAPAPDAPRKNTGLIAAVVGLAVVLVLAAVIGIPLALSGDGRGDRGEDPPEISQADAGTPSAPSGDESVEGYPEPGAESATGDAAPVPLEVGANGRTVTGGAPWTAGAAFGGTCGAASGGLQISRDSDGWFKCPWPTTVFGGEQQITVTTTLVTHGACASIWFLMNDPDGYALHVCQDELRLDRQPVGGAKTPIGAKRLPSPIPLDTPVTLTVRLGGGKVTVWRDSAQAAVIPLRPGTPPSSGMVTFGSSGSDQVAPPPYTVRLTDITVRSTS